MTAAASRSGVEPIVPNILAQELRGRPLSEFERALIALLQHDMFRRVDNLRNTEACALTYERLRYLRAHLDLSIASVMSDFDRLLALHEWVGLVDGTMATILTIHFNLCIGTILQHREGRAALRPLLDELDTMDAFGVFLATELAHGNNLQALETEALYDHAAREFVLHTPRREAQKFMPNTGADGVGKLAVVLARLRVGGVARGVYPFVVRIRTALGPCPGVRVMALGDKPDYALDNAITVFDHVRVPFDHWLSGADSRIDLAGRFTSATPSSARRFLAAISRVQLGKLCLSHAAIGGMRASLALTFSYAAQRRSFGPGRHDVAIVRYQSYQHALLNGLAVTYAASFFGQQVRARFEARGTDDEDVQRELAVIKLYASTRATEVFLTCRERLGAQGMFCANRVISYLVCVQGIVTAEGDNEILRLRMARQLVHGLATPPQIPAGLLPEAVSLTAGVISMLHKREAQLIHKLRSEAARDSAKLSLFDTWNAQAHDLLELAELHVERLVLEAFAMKVLAVSDAKIRELLSRLLRLCALHELHKRTAPLTAAGLLTGPELAQLERERAHVYTNLAPQLAALIEASEIPASVLDSPIASDYLAAYDCMTPGAKAAPPRT